MVNIQIKGLKELERALDPKLFQKAANTTLNRVGQMAKTASSKEIRKTYTLPSKRITQGIKVKRSNWTDLEYTIKAKGKTPGLQHYKAKQLKRGVRVKVRKDRGRKLMAGAFMPTRIKGVYVRKGKGRFPIKRLFGPSVRGMMSATGVDTIKKVVAEKFEAIMMHNLKYFGRKVK